MITTCTGCQARYRLDADKVPQRKIRVRCPDCGDVFELDGSVREAPAPMAAGAAIDRTPTPVPEPAPAPAGSLDLDLEPAADVLVPEPTPAADGNLVGELTLEPASPAAGPAASLDSDAAASAKPASGGVAVADAPKQGRRRRRDKSEMLARALVSDILVYNREARDKALAAGNLLEALGPEIKKSWELYKEKVGAESATGTSHFKDALNEILAEGQDIF